MTEMLNTLSEMQLAIKLLREVGPVQRRVCVCVCGRACVVCARASGQLKSWA
jgi:hypothetical protein